MGLGDYHVLPGRDWKPPLVNVIEAARWINDLYCGCHNHSRMDIAMAYFALSNAILVGTREDFHPFLEHLHLCPEEKDDCDD